MILSLAIQVFFTQACHQLMRQVTKTRSLKLQSSLVLAIFVVYLLNIQGGESIKCWVCRSDGDPKCADPFDNTSFPINDCKIEKEREHLPGLEPTMCRKIRQKVNGNWRYIRGCAWLGEPGIGRDERYCIHRSGTYNVHMEFCTCRSKDGCNSARKMTSSSSSFLLVSLFSTSIVATYLLSSTSMTNYATTSLFSRLLGSNR